MSQPSKPRYRTTNWKQYNASLKARGSLTVWLDKRMCWFAAASGKRGRSPKFSDGAIQFCLTLKNLFDLALKQTTGVVKSVLQLCGLDMASARFQYAVQAATRSECLGAIHTQPNCPAHAVWIRRGLSSWAGEWKCKKAWLRAPTLVAQAAHWY